MSSNWLQDVDVRLCLSVFNEAGGSGAFTGCTGHTSDVALSNGQAVFEEAMYCLLVVPNSSGCLAVVEVVVSLPGSTDRHSVGWSVVPIPLSETDGVGSTRTVVYHGSPRVLPQLSPGALPALKTAGRPVMRSTFTYTIDHHPVLASIRDLLPSNTFVGCQSMIPGVHMDRSDPFCLDKPMTTPKRRCCLDAVEVTFQTGRKAFEKLLLERVQAVSTHVTLTLTLQYLLINECDNGLTMLLL